MAHLESFAPSRAEIQKAINARPHLSKEKAVFEFIDTLTVPDAPVETVGQGTQARQVVRSDKATGRLPFLSKRPIPSRVAQAMKKKILLDLETYEDANGS